MLKIYGGQLTFDDDAHVYQFNGTPIAGVTSILKTINKPALIQWSATTAANFVKDHWHEGMGKNDIELLCREAARAHNKVRDTAAGIGTEVHSFVEASLKGQPLPKITSEAAFQACNAFMNWRQQHTIKSLANEQILFSKNWWYAGTADILAMVDGKLTLADIKTSSGIYPEMFMQVGAYTNALEEMRPDLKIEQWMIVRLDKKTGQLEVGSMPRTQIYIDAFLRCRELAKCIQTIEELKHEHLATSKTEVRREPRKRAAAPREAGQRPRSVRQRKEALGS